MRFFFALIVFVLAVAACTVVAKVVYQSSVEGELGSLATAALRKEGFTKVDVEFDHHVPSFSGHVNEPEDRAKVLETVKEAVPIAMMPDLEDVDLPILPTIPPSLRIVVKAGEAKATVAGALAVAEEESRAHFGSRLQALARIDTVDNQIELDPRRLLFIRAAEMAALSGELITHSDEAEVRLEEGRLLLRGEVPNEGIKAGIIELAAKVEADTVVDEIKVAPPETFFLPSVLTMTRNRFGITVSGVVDSPETLRQLQEIFAKHGKGRRITDRLAVDEERVAASWQGDFGAFLPVCLEQLKGELTVEFAEQQIRINGEVADEAGKEAVLEKVRLLNQSDKPREILSDIRIRAASPKGPPVRMIATWESGLLTLIGNVPSTSFVEALEKVVGDDGEKVLVKNSLEETPSSPGDNWEGRLRELFEEILRRTKNATVRIGEETVKIEGMAKELPDLRVLNNVIINAVPPGYSIENQLVHADQPFPMPELAPEAREKLETGLSGLSVYFDTGSETLNADAEEVVDSILSLLKEGGAQTDLIVTGFADNFGNPESNRELSLRRAEAVVERLVEAGIDESRITKDSSVENVRNVPRSQRWKSRRVEVSLPEPEEEIEENEENP